jgi:hypothetical protein
MKGSSRPPDLGRRPTSEETLLEPRGQACEADNSAADPWCEGSGKCGQSHDYMQGQLGRRVTRVDERGDLRKPPGTLFLG